MQKFSPETSILHKTQTLLQQMTEVVSIQHCIKVNKFKLVANWSEIKQHFFFFIFHSTKSLHFSDFFPFTHQEINFENQVEIPLDSEFSYSFFTDKYRSPAEVFFHCSLSSFINCRKNGRKLQLRHHSHKSQIMC